MVKRDALRAHWLMPTGVRILLSPLGLGPSADVESAPKPQSFALCVRGPRIVLSPLGLGPSADVESAPKPQSFALCVRGSNPPFPIRIGTQRGC